MYPHFIEVHDKETGNPVLINIDAITYLYADNVHITTQRSFTGDLWTRETYDEVKELIRSAGCAIQKQDPRMDTTSPISWDELLELRMIGQPVWNSNTREWMLVIDSAGIDRAWVDLVNISGKVIRFEPHDVTKYPLYRMRKPE